MTDQKLRMDAYYYGFDLTGAPEIDLILSAVACAGKSFHHTDQWNDQSEPWPAHTGNSPAEWIQNAAIIAAEGNKQASAEIARLHGENEFLRKDAERYRWLRERAQQDVDGWRNEVPVLVHALSHVSEWKDRIDESIDDAMSKEASHG